MLSSLFSKSALHGSSTPDMGPLPTQDSSVGMGGGNNVYAIYAVIDFQTSPSANPPPPPPPENCHVPKKGTILKGNFLFQPSIFGGYFSFQGGMLKID